ncbi:MAG: protein kinase [Gemmataceae bacterium]|nr:protein kinase [Gemmataceae bacterium]
MSRCPSEKQLDLFLEEQLTDADVRSVSAHVAVCERCQSVLERLTGDVETDEPSVVLSRSSVAAGAALESRPSVDFLLRLRQTPPGALARESTSPRHTAELAAETPQVSGYEIIREVGRGGMGVVYQARHLGLNRLVALKMVRTGVNAGPKELERFRQEAEAVARLHHPNIVQIYDIGESAGRPYLALEYVPGGSLVQHLRGDPQPVYPAARLVETLARAVHVAHTNDIVHRDLKPANILLSNQELRDESPEPSSPESNAERPEPKAGASNLDSRLSALGSRLSTPKITDFGLAKRIDAQTSGTETGEVVGTPSYMAPEQAAGRGRPVGPAADVYALGAILYEMLTGRPPFKGPTALDTVLQVIHEEPVRPSGLRPKLPRDLETICLKCLEKEPYRRYSSALALAADLARFRHGSPIHARPVSARERVWKWARRRPVQAGLLACLVVVTVLGFAGITWQWQEAAAARDTALAEKREKEEQKEQADVARSAAELAQLQAAEQRRQARVALYYSRIAQSELQWRVNDYVGAEHALSECLPTAGLVDRRGWEWYYLRGLYRTYLFTLRHRTEGISGDVSVRPDGRWIASVQGGHSPDAQGKTAEVRIWDARSGDVVHVWTVPATYHRLAFSPDGKGLALAGTDGTIVLRNTETREEVLRYRPHTDSVAGLVFSPDGKRLASASWDGLIKIRAIESDGTRTLKGHTGRVYDLAFHPDGDRVASAGEDGTVRLWDSHKGEPLQVYRGHKSAVFGVAFSPNGELLVSAGSNGNLKLWDVATGRVTQSLTGQVGAVLNVAFSPDGRYLAYGGGDMTVRVWDVESGVERIVFRGHTAAVDGVHFTPDGQRLVSGSAGQAAVKVWDLTRHPEFATLARTGADIEALAFAEGGRKLVSISVGGQLQTWDASSGVLEDERSLPLSAKVLAPAVLAAFSADGRLLVARGRNDSRMARAWNVADGAEMAVLRGHQVPINCVRFSSDGKRVATGGCDTLATGQAQEVKVWDVQTGTELASVQGKGPLFNIAFSPDGHYLALAGEGGLLSVLDWSAGQTQFQVVAHRGDVSALAFSPSGKRLASAGLEDRTVKVWDWTAKPPRNAPALILTAPTFVCDLTFNPDGGRLAGIGRDMTKLWDAETGQEVMTLRGAPQRHYDPAFNPRLIFSPDGKRLAGTNWDESISVWEGDAQGGPPALERRQAARRRAADERATFWHVQEAEHCLEHKNLPAARFHLQQLAGKELSEPLRIRRARLAIQLEKP